MDTRTTDPVDGADTLAARAASLIAERIRSGELRAGERLNIRELVAVTNIGATPLREGLSRLIARGLVRTIDRRGFRVAEMSREDLDDILRTRLPLETEALRLSIANGGNRWEARVVGALHRLVTFMSWAPKDPGEASRGFDEVHKEFHAALISACGSPRMLEFLDMLYDQGFRYRHLMLSRGDPREHLKGAQRIDEHRRLADLAVQRKSGEAVEVLREHLLTFPADVFGDSGLGPQSRG